MMLLSSSRRDAQGPPGIVTRSTLSVFRQVLPAEEVGRLRAMEDKRFLPPERPPRKPGQEPTARLTLDAYVRMRKELEHLKGEGRKQMGDRLLHARELGDIRENAEYDAAKNEQGLMEARI